MKAKQAKSGIKAEGNGATPQTGSRTNPGAPALQPFWKGPQEDGITNSLLCKFLVCRDRFRLLTVHGLKEAEGFNHSMEYGTLWHAAEEYHFGKLPGGWQAGIAYVHSRLLRDYPSDHTEVVKWTKLCIMQFPIYLQYWAKQPQRTKITYPLQEYPFRVRYQLPSGRYVYLRGKIDGIRAEGLRSTYVKENKTKGTIDEEGISKSVKFNLQTMIYFLAYRQIVKEFLSGAGLPADLAMHGMSASKAPITSLKLPTGVLYNVIRRPLSEKYAPRQKKAESEKEFYKRVSELMLADPKKYFIQKKVQITAADCTVFENEILIPILEQLCDWWEWIKADPAHPFRIAERLSSIRSDPVNYHPRAIPGVPGGGIHYRYPFGVYNSLSGGFRGDYFEFLTSGNVKHLSKATSLFPELEAA